MYNLDVTENGVVIQDAASRLPKIRSVLWSLVELIGITGIGVAQPLFESLRINVSSQIIGSNPSRIQLISLTVLVVVLPAFALLLTELIVGVLFRRHRAAVHQIIVAAVVGVIAWEILGNLTTWVTWLLLIGSTLAFGIAFVSLRRFASATTFLRVLAITPVFFGVMFLLGPNIRPMFLTGNSSPNADVHVENPHRIVVIVADEFALGSLLDGSGQIDDGLFPNISALASDARWYRNATTVAPYTLAAVPAIATSLYTKSPYAPAIAANYPNSLFSLVGSEYSINAIESSQEALCSRAACEPDKGTMGRLITNAVRLWSDFVKPGSSNPVCFCDLSTISDGLPHGEEFVASIQPSSTPRLDYLHVLLPHSPWIRLPDGRIYDTEATSETIPDGLDINNNPGTWVSEEAALAARQRYLLQTQTLDALVGKVTDRLREIGAYDDSLIVLTADHGVSFDAGHSRRAPDRSNYEDILWVPLVMKYPGNIGAGSTDDRTARSIDILPTIADSLKVKIPWKIDGVSLLRREREEDSLKVLKFATNLQTLKGKSKNDFFRRYAEIPGFQRVLAAPTISLGSRDDLRLYGYGSASEFHSLVGRDAGPLVRGDPELASGWLTWVKASDGSTAPWTFVRRTLTDKDQAVIAIVVNGKVAGLGRSSTDLLGNQRVSIIAAPSLFKTGSNTVGTFSVEGDPTDPVLKYAGVQPEFVLR